MHRAHSFKSAAQPSPTAANLPLPPGVQNTASSASAGTSARRANGPEKRLNAESMDVEQLISALDHYTTLAAKATKDRAAQLPLRNDADAHKHHLDIRLDDAITAAERGDGEAVKTLVTIAAADGLVGALAAKAREAIERITHSSAAKTGAASNSADTIRTAISSLQEAYGAHMGDGTKEWVDSALRMSLSDRQAQIPTAQGRASVGASAASQPAGEAVNRRPETPEISEVRPPTRKFFSDEELLPAMLRLKRDRFKVLSTGGGATFPSQGNVTDQVGGMVRSAFAKQNKPAVTLYHQAHHWVAIIAMPPAADAQNAKPSLIIFDSNAKQPLGDGTPSQVVGPTIAAALNGAGYEVHTAFGSIQDGMAANGCGPLCVAAIDAAFASSSAAEPALTAEVIAKRLNQYIQDFSSANQNQRDRIIASAEAFIESSSPKPDRGSRGQPASTLPSAGAPPSPSAAPLPNNPRTRATVAARPHLLASVDVESLQRNGRFITRSVENANRELAAARKESRELSSSTLLGNVRRLGAEASATFARRPEQIAAQTAANSRRESQRAERLSSLHRKMEALQTQIADWGQLAVLNKRRLELAETHNTLVTDLRRLNLGDGVKASDVQRQSVVAAKRQALQTADTEFADLGGKYQVLLERVRSAS